MLKGENTLKTITKSFFLVLSGYTDCKIDLFYIRKKNVEGKVGRIVVAEDIDIDYAYKLLKEENAWYKNIVLGKDVYFSWSKKNESFNIAFVDDIENLERFKKKGFMLVKTSARKYQGHFLLNRGVSYDEMLKIQRVLCDVYKGDTGALSPVQLRRVAGFLNNKYEKDNVVDIVFSIERYVDVDRILEYYEEHFKKEIKPISAIGGSINKTWEDFANVYKRDGEIDYSRVDMKYSCYLLRKGLDIDEVKRKLEQESKNLFERKGKYMEDYIDRTVKKAWEYVSSENVVTTGFSKADASLTPV